MLRVLVLATGGLYAVSLVPGMRPRVGHVALSDLWASNLFVAGVVALLVTHAARARRDRAAWLPNRRSAYEALAAGDSLLRQVGPRLRGALQQPFRSPPCPCRSMRASGSPSGRRTPSDTVIGVEALVRWRHPQRGVLYPDAFIAPAESSGLMEQLTATVLDLALAQCRAWSDQGHPLSTAVDVSPSDLIDHDPDGVRALLARHRLSPTALVLEVTESLLMEDRTRAVSVLTRLRDAGTGIAIDDDGTGCSSLAYLAELPVTSSSSTAPPSGA